MAKAQITHRAYALKNGAVDALFMARCIRRRRSCRQPDQKSCRLTQ